MITMLLDQLLVGKDDLAFLKTSSFTELNKHYLAAEFF